VGPFFSFGLVFPTGPYPVDEGTPGSIWLRGQVVDGAGEPVPDALIETWQASPETREGFRGFGRCATDADGRYGILTLKPGTVPGPGDSTQAPHLAMSVFARGLLDRVVTRVYFGDEAEANAADPIVTSVSDPARRDTLIARVDGDGYVFDIHLQGESETVFFSI
jgi:protocatechuate 3,4-dioxygenase alpha subunit